MSRDKQIEEIADLEHLLRIRRIDIEKQGYDIWALIKGTTSEEQAIAEYLIGHSYRKASEVALEAIDDFQRTIRHIFLDMCNGNDYNTLHLLQLDSAIEALFDNKIAELKKKYIGKDTNVTTKTEGEK